MSWLMPPVARIETRSHPWYDCSAFPRNCPHYSARDIGGKGG